MQESHAISEEYRAPKFDYNLVQQWTPYLGMMIENNLVNVKWSDASISHEDLMNELLTHLWMTTKLYDPTKGMKWRSYAIMTLRDKLKNFIVKMNRIKRVTTFPMTEVAAGWGITGTEEHNPNDPNGECNVSRMMDSQVHALAAAPNAVNELCDARIVYDRLNPLEQKVFEELYVKAKTLREFCNENEGHTWYKIRRIKRRIERICNTLVHLDCPV